MLQSPKVVVQRNNDLMQTNMTQIIDQNQPIQFHFSPSVEQNQAYQIIPPQQAQQIKQTIYPQQSNQVRRQILLNFNLILIGLSIF